ncbi:MAG: Tol-Pal system beta propeller repeat protein TolB [Desulfobacteraceae bacterium]|nr:Tol-Pal system beta propeller repeat protein TolB [Desulfobacteraceae bacterium]
MGLEENHEIVIDKPSIKKLPIAIPLFKTIPGNRPDLSRGASDMLWNTLEFTGYFKMLDRNTFLEDPQTFDVTFSDGTFHKWTRIGAELVVTGSIWIKDNNMIEMELRLFDSFKKQLLIGKEYRGWIKDQQRMVRRFCSDVIYMLSGNRGLFESKIAFVSTGTGNKEIYTCDFDGQNPRQFTNDKNIALFPAWSWDGKWLAYTSYKRRKPDIYIKHYRDKRGTVIAKKGINTTPAWLPGKSMLSATLSFEGSQDIYLLTDKGRVTKRLTRKWGIDTSPTWSPDGKKMAFVSDRAGSPQIYIKDLYSGTERRLTFDGSKYNTQPSWSPKGDQIAYSSMERGEINIRVIGFDGRSPRQLTYNSGKNESPSWSPDGSMIVFSSTREGYPKIYVMTVRGTDQRRLLSLPGRQTGPAWSPRAVN